VEQVSVLTARKGEIKMKNLLLVDIFEGEKGKIVCRVGNEDSMRKDETIEETFSNITDLKKWLWYQVEMHLDPEE